MRIIWGAFFIWEIFVFIILLYGQSIPGFPIKENLGGYLLFNVFCLLFFGYLTFRKKGNNQNDRKSSVFSNNHEKISHNYSSSSSDGYNFYDDARKRELEAIEDADYRYKEQRMDDRRYEAEQKAEREAQDLRDFRQDQIETSRKMDEEYREYRQNQIEQEEERKRQWYEDHDY